MEIIKKIIHQTTPAITITGITTGNVLITGCTGTCRVTRTGTMGTITGKIVISGATSPCKIIVTSYTGSSDSITPTYHLKFGLVSVVKDIGFLDAYTLDEPYDLIGIIPPQSVITTTTSTTTTTTLAPTSTTTTIYTLTSTTTGVPTTQPPTSTTTTPAAENTLYIYIPIL